VTTRAVYEGLIVDHDPEPPVCVADTDEQFAEHVVKLLRSQAERSRLIAPARRYVERHFDWSRNAQFLEEMCLAAVASNGKN
jgi:glycosyltransferase involved in cell wall biosynthesis